MRSVFNLTSEFLLRRHLIVLYLEISPQYAFHPINLKNDPSKNTEEGGIKTGELGRKDFKVPASERSFANGFVRRNALQLPRRM
jgi:hypothetical protein